MWATASTSVAVRFAKIEADSAHRSSAARSRCTLRGWPRRGYLVFDALAALGLTIALVALFAQATHQFAQARRENDARRTLRLAAEQELARLRAGLPSGAATSAEPANHVRVYTTLQPAAEAWSGLRLAVVRAEQTISGGRRVAFELRGVVPPEGAP